MRWRLIFATFRFGDTLPDSKASGKELAQLSASNLCVQSVAEKVCVRAGGGDAVGLASAEDGPCAPGAPP